MIDVEKYFKKSDLLPAIVQEDGTGEVLMLAYMNRESMRKTLETGVYLVLVAFKKRTLE